LKDKGLLDEAIAADRQAIAINPNFAEGHFNLGIALLECGDFEQGWPEYEWRQKCSEFNASFRRFSQPLWSGEEFRGRTILLHAEQGLGDTIQFIRYLPMLVRRGGRVLVEVQPALMGLLRQMRGVHQWIPRGEPLPGFDVQCPLLSLPRLFATTVRTIPADVPYLLADPALVESWRQNLSTNVPGIKVGLAWAGNPEHKRDAMRSISLDRLAPLASVRGATFISLQKGGSALQSDQPPEGLRLVNFSAELHDFADTAALMANLDVVIAVDTAIAHLAGAMGKPVWTLLPFAPDWRWLVDRKDSPWYPSMRLFRQPRIGDWGTVIGSVAGRLESLAR